MTLQLPELSQYPSYGCDVTISIIISVNDDVVQIYDNEYVKLLCKDLIDKLLDACRCVRQPKRYHLIFQMTVSSSKRGLPLVSFADSHLIVCTGKVELGKPPSPS